MNDFQFFKEEHQELNEQLNFIGKKVDDYEEDLQKIINKTYITPVTTGIAQLDPHFNMFMGMLFIVTGYPQSGKSEFLRFMACSYICNSRGKVAIFSPESDTPILMMDIITTIQALTKYSYQDSKKIANEYFEFIEIRDNKGMPDIQAMMDSFDDLNERGFNFFIIDPMNWVTSSLYTNQGAFESLRLTLTQLKQFAKRTKSIVAYVEHPKTPQPNREGEYPPCNIFSVNGGTMHNNKVDGAIILHRQKQEDEFGKRVSSQNDPVLCEIGKLKMQRYLGTPSNVVLKFDFKTGIYY